MKNYFKYLTILCVSLMFTSCLVDDVDETATNDEGPNLASFRNTSGTLGAIANGDEYAFDIQVEVLGPTITDQTGDVQLTVTADPSSTAIEGTHYSLPSPTMTLTEAANYLGTFPVTLLSDGILAPLAVSPKLVLALSDASGDNVVANGKKITLTLNYLCFSNLAGTYNTVTRYVRGGADVSTTNGTDVLTETGTGEYRTGLVGHWSAAALGGTPGMTFFDVCNGITIPNQNLVDLYSNEVEGVLGNSFVDPDTGIITFNYRHLVCFW